MKMKIKPQYERSENKKSFDDIGRTSFKKVIDFSEKDYKEKIINQKDSISDNNNQFYSDVWCLFGREKESGEWICLQVAKQRDIFGEIVEDIQLLFPEKENLVNEISNAEYRDTQFYTNVYKAPEKCRDYRRYIYGDMAGKYKEFRLGILNIESYLRLEKLELNSKNVSNILQIAAPAYAEALLAHETLAVYWNAYRGGVDGQTISLLQTEARQNDNGRD